MKGLYAWVIGAMCALSVFAVATPARADDGYGGRPWGLMQVRDHDRGEHFRRGDDRGRHRGYVFDRRYHHDRYYPPRGFFMRGLPRNYLLLYYGGVPYYYGQGIWYHRSGMGFVVVTPPVGIVVPVLPPYYTTVWVGGVPYYYANGVYYAWQPAAQGYVVMQVPPDASTMTQTPASPGTLSPSSNPDQFYIYPEKGQSPKQQSKDRYECHRWAVGQTGFDPSQPATGLTPSQLMAKRADYRRAIEACLDARGYSVK